VLAIGLLGIALRLHRLDEQQLAEGMLEVDADDLGTPVP
jgi:hypothetical protein